MTIVENRPSSDGLASIRRDFLATGDAATALAERNAQVDRLVLEAAAGLLIPTAPAGLSVLAVGGYGRRQLFPYSDVDLLLLFESEKLALASKDGIAAFLRHLWDSDLRVSHSVRTPAECAEVHERNIELNISLLDQRYLTGDRALYAGLADKLPRFIQGNRGPLVRNLTQLARVRHSKYAGTFYHLEPNVKETPGGLRDHQLVCWLDQLHGTREGPAPELEAAFRFLGGSAATCIASRGATTTRYRSTPRTPSRSCGGMATPPDGCASTIATPASFTARPSARWIRARPNSARYSRSSATGARALRTPISAVHRERVHFRAPQRLDVEPELALSLFEFVARHGIRLSFEAEQQIESRIARLRAHFAEPRPLWPALNQILVASARAAGRPGDARNRRAGRHFSGDGADRMPGDPRLLSPLHGGRAHAGRHAEPQDRCRRAIAICWRK